MKKLVLSLAILLAFALDGMAQNGGNGILDYTTYDWQSNAGARNWTKVWPDGKVNFAFNVASTTDFSDRGTAICTYDANTDAWTLSGGRVENEKASFGSIAQYGENGLVVASYSGTDGCRVYIAPDKDNIVPNSLSPVSALDDTYNPGWPAVMTSGANRDIIHIVANAIEHTDVPGAVGTEQPVIYFRSTDGGQTWDKQNVVLPYMGSAYCVRWDSNSCYWMETTDDNCLALVVNNGWSDGMVLCSYDDGETWERKLFYQHPNPFGFDDYNQMFLYPRWTSCQWDDQHHLHVLYEYNGHLGEQGSYDHFPNIGGVAYWNETMPYYGDGTTAVSAIPGNLTPGEPFVMDTAYLMQDIHRSWFWPDRTHDFWPEYFGYCSPLADDGFVDATDDLQSFPLIYDAQRYNHGTYLQGICAFPVLCKAGDNKWVAIWCGLDENHRDDNFHYYYHLFASYSSDNGVTWTRQVHLTSSAAFNNSEMIYPQAVVIGNKLVVAVEEDSETGAFAGFGENDANPNDCFYHGLTFELDKYFGDHTITATSEPSEFGMVTGAGTYHYGELCTLTATPNAGCVFVNWTKNDAVVSAEASFTFRVEEGGDYEAHFAMQPSAYDFQSGNLLYTIISTNPPCVSLSGHVDNANAQGELVIPETVEYESVNYSVTDIGYRAFYQCNLLSGDLVIPNTVTHISSEAFTGCTGFTGSLVIPNNMIELGTDVSMATNWDGVFQGCSGFTHLVLGESVQKIGYSCFFGCSGFTGPLLLPNGILEIWDSAFAGCLGFNGELVLPSSLTQIGKEAFMDCANLTGTLAIPETIATVGYGAFSGCSGIENIVLPSHYVFAGNGLGNPGDYVFSGCTSLTSIEIPDGWEKTSTGTFSRCSNLRSVRLPQSLKEIGQSCFEHCTNLSDINIPERVTKINAFAFSHCSNLTEFDFPDSLTLIGSGAFRYCTGLSGVMRIPDPVEQIYVFAFDSCVGITSVVLGPSLNPINESAFEYTMLKSILLKATTPPALIRSSNENAWHFPIDIPITVPCGTLEAYQNAEGWTDFTNITEDCGSGLIEFHGSEWYYEIVDEYGNVTYQHLEYVADTTVNHKDVQIIIRTNTLYDKGEHQEVTREYLYVEDNIVYWWNSELEEFTVLYDLGAQQGDSWVIKVGTETLTMHVDAVDQYYYEGQSLRMLRVSDAEDLFSGTIVCGVGHLSSFFPERLMTRGKDYRVQGLRCYWSYGNLAFTVNRDDCDAIYTNLHNGIEEDGPSTGSGTFAVYPNPTHGVLFVETRRATSLPAETVYRITNLTGQTVLTGNLNAETQQIDVSGLPQGMYFITVGDMTQKFVVR